ncbi:DUF445 domain-containing protein [Desulfosporosinus orientis]|nr:DUF445 domain-containing protein [Desulfosporosinus orientis]
MDYHKKANLILSIVFILFLSAAAAEHFYPGYFGVRLVHFVLEAAFVGGIADWFAVTAIFKKPLGWGFHTALIPRNREKVIQAIATMVQSELLHVDLIRKKIEGISFVEYLIDYLNKKGGSLYLTNMVVPFLQSYIKKQSPDRLANGILDYLRKNADAGDLVSTVQGVSGWALNHGYIDIGLNRLAEELWDKAADGETRQVIIRYLEEIKQQKVSNGGAIFRTLIGFVEMSDGLNLDEAADALQVELLLTLRKLKDPDQELRITLKDNLIKGIIELAQDSESEKRIQQWKGDLLKDPSLVNFLENLITVIQERLTDSSGTLELNVLHRILYPYFDSYWTEMKNNKALQERINLFIVDLLCRVMKNEHDVIGNMVRETLEAYTDEDLNQFVQDKAGNDLQWIRINGSMIGGIVGFVLFIFLEFIYNPLVVPAVINYFQ